MKSENDGLLCRVLPGGQERAHSAAPLCTSTQMPLGQFQVGSHQLQVEARHQIPQENRLSQTFHLHETKKQFILRCPHYYEIRGPFQCVFREFHNSLSTFFQYPYQLCLAFYLGKALKLRAHILHP